MIFNKTTGQFEVKIFENEEEAFDECIQLNYYWREQGITAEFEVLEIEENEAEAIFNAILRPVISAFTDESFVTRRLYRKHRKWVKPKEWE